MNVYLIRSPPQNHLLLFGVILYFFQKVGSNMKNNKDKTLALAYCRYSSHAQDSSLSIPSQTTTIETYAEAHNICIENYYIDMAKTGRNQNRPELKRLKTDIESGQTKAKIVIVRSIDRMNRNAKNQLNDLEWFAKHGIRLISVTDDVDTATETSKLLTTIKAAVAEDYSETLSRNTRAAMIESAKQCRHLGGSPPLGYIVNSEGFYEIDENRARIIRDIFRLYLQDMGYDHILKYLKARNYTTSQGKDFSKSSLNTILKNPKYIGTYVYDRSTPKDSEGKRNSHTSKEKYVVIPNGMPAIIDARDFEKVQEKMAENAKKHSARASKNYYALNGLLRCSKCGKAFTGNVNHSNNNRYYQYKASCQCKTKSVSMEKLNNFVFYAVQQCVFDSDNKDMLIQMINRRLANKRNFQSAEINELQCRISDIETAQENLMQYLEEGKGSNSILNKISKNEIELESLRVQLADSEKEIASVDDEAYDRLIKKFTNYMGTVKSSDALKLRNALINRINIGDEDVEINFNSGVPISDNITQYFNERND